MRHLILAAGVAALAISVPAAAKPERDKDGRTAKAAKVERGGGKRVEARGKADVRVAVAQERGQKRADNRREQRVEKRSEQRVEKRAKARVERREDRREALVERRDDRRVVVADRRRDDGRKVVRVANRDFERDRWERIFGDRGVPAHWAHGCPPGLAKKYPRCIPPGQAKKLGDTIILGRRLPTAYARNVLPVRLRNIYRDDNRFTYRYGDGYVYRVDRDKQLVSALMPLIGAGLGIGTPFPYTGANYFVPTTYRPFYRDRNDDYYRYANGYVYEIDRDTGLVEDMIPLLDRGYGIGQMLPASYGAYNVPMQYRPMYYDTPDAQYRYAPGAIYQVDPSTQLITSVASLLAPGLGVGQALPPAYSAYNVPLGYRDQYYDTADNWYRYNNGNIYQVDPTTQLVTALIRAIV